MQLVLPVRMARKRTDMKFDELKKSSKGAYILEFRIDEPFHLIVGKLGRIKFEPGWYYYAGSAMNGLKARIQRHIDGTGKCHWHVDYLRKAIPPVRVWYMITENPAENIVVEKLRAGCEGGIKGFGCSDDRKSGTHLFYSKRRQNFRKAMNVLVFHNND